MKKFAISAIAVAATMLIGSANAAGVDSPQNATFNVNLTLVPKCIIATATEGASSATVGNITISYNAFGDAKSSGNSFVVRCSTSLPYGMTLDHTSVTDGATGLAYTMALTTSDAADGSSPNGTLASQTGSASGNTYYVKAYVPAGQAGTTTAGTANNTHMVTVNY
jgi:hypothetical protein